MASFAGSQRLDERRRRRLAVENEPGSGLTDDPPLAAGLREAAHPRLGCPVLNLFPGGMWFYGALAGALGAGLIVLTAASFFAPTWKIGTWGPVAARLLSVQRPSLLTWCGDTLVLLAAQVAVFIWWARARGSKDFGGSYRLWGWVTAAGIGTHLVLTTGLHRVLSQALPRSVPMLARLPNHLVWLVPALVVGYLLFWALQRELRGCRLSRGALFAAAGTYNAVALMVLLEPQLTTWWGRFVVGWLEMTLLAAGHFAALICLCLHARHVIHVSADPPPELPARTAWWRAWLAAWRTKRPAVQRRAVRAAEDEEEAAPRKRKRKTTRSTRTPTRKTRVVVEEPDLDAESDDSASNAAEDDDAAIRAGSEDPFAAESSDDETETAAADRDAALDTDADDEPVDSFSRNRSEDDEESASAGDADYSFDDESSEPDEPRNERRVRIDQPSSEPGAPHRLPAEALKGLSKRERRRMQQELRERERSARRG